MKLATLLLLVVFFLAIVFYLTEAWKEYRARESRKRKTSGGDQATAPSHGDLDLDFDLLGRRKTRKDEAEDSKSEEGGFWSKLFDGDGMGGTGFDGGGGGSD